MADAPDVDALVALPDGGLLFGERAAGAILRTAEPGRVKPTLAAERLSVSTNGQRGLLGLAVDRAGRVFAAWTERGGEQRLVVAQVAPGPVRTVWAGPPSKDKANGGHLAFASDGRLLIGIGDLLDPPKRFDPAAPNGKLLALDPDGAADQRPAVVSAGWNNPFAFAVTPSGAVWVADNSPGESPERLGRGDGAGAGGVARPGSGARPGRMTDLGRHTVPASVAAIDDGRLVLCRYATRRLTVFEVDRAGRAVERQTLAGDCAAATAVLTDGRVVYSDGERLRVVPAPAPG